MITVVNKYKHTPTKNDIYIGRGSILGNPYTHMKNTKARYMVESREVAVECYKRDLYNLLNDVIIENEQNLLNRIFKQRYLDELQRIKQLAEKGDVNLVCFCSPKACHGDVIKEIVEQYIKEEKDFI